MSQYANGAPLPVGMSVWRWSEQTGQRERIEHWQGIGASERTLWIDLEGVTEREAAAAAVEAMELPGFSRSMLGFVLEGVGPGGPGQEQTLWYDASITEKLRRGEGVRFLNSYSALANIPVGVYDTPVLYLRKVSFLVGGRWLITNRTRGIGMTLGAAYTCDAVSRDELLAELRARWRTSLSRHPGDIATLMLLGLVTSFRGALDAMDRRLQDAELSYVRHHAAPATGGDLNAAGYRRELLAMKWLIDGFARDVARLNRYGTPARTAWFQVLEAATEAVEIQTLISEALEQNHRQREGVRAGLELIATQQTSDQLELQRREQSRTARFESSINLIAAVLLAPTLIATLFGALTAVFGDRPTERFLLVVGLMVAAGVISWLGLRRLQRQGDDKPSPASELPEGKNGS